MIPARRLLLRFPVKLLVCPKIYAEMVAILIFRRLDLPLFGDKFGESLGGSQAPPSFPRKSPDFPGSSPNFPGSFSATSPEVLSLCQ